MRLASLPHPAVKAALERGVVALLPVGAIEAHGPHLPLDTDVRIAEETCQRAIPKIADRLELEALMLPPIAYSLAEYARPFAGTMSISSEVARAYLTEVLTSAARQGFRAVCLVNAHLEPAHRKALKEASQAARQTAKEEGVGCPIVVADPADRRWVSRLTEEFRSGKCHAGRYETSLVIATPDAPVDRSVMTTLPPVDIDLVGGMKAGYPTFLEMGATAGYFGDPSRATSVEGHEVFARLADIVVEVVLEAIEPADLDEWPCERRDEPSGA